MKTFKNLTFALLAAGSLAACSASRTGTGSGTGTTGTSGGSSMDSTSSQTSSNTSSKASDSPDLSSMGSSTTTSGNTSSAGTSINGSPTIGSMGSSTASLSNGSGAGIRDSVIGGANMATTNQGLGGSNRNSGTFATGSVSTPSYSGSGNFANRTMINSTYSSDLSAQAFLPQAAQSGMKEVELSRIAQQKASHPKVKEFAEMMVKQHTKKNQQLHALAASKAVSINDSTAVGAGSTTIGQLSGRSSIGGSKSLGATNNGTTGNLSGNSETGVSTSGLSGNNANNTLNSGSSSNGSLNNHMGTMSDASINKNLNSGTEELNNLSGAAFDKKYLEIMIRDHEQAVDLFSKAMESNDAQVKAFASKSLPALRAHLYDAKRLNNQLAW